MSELILGSKGYPKGQARVIYLMPMSRLRLGMADPTLHYVSDDEIEEEVERFNRDSYKPADKVERGVFGVPNAVAMYWFHNPEDSEEKS